MNPTETRLGFAFGVMAYSLWGIFPLFFNLLASVPATEVLSHRIIWTFLFVTFILFLRGWQRRVISTLTNPQLLKGLFASSFLVSCNWLVFIWAVGHARVVESSLGYFLTPLVSVLLARVFLRESLNTGQLLAIVLAATGVLWLIVKIGYLPWVSLVLAVTFGLYGLVRKRLDVDTVSGLTVETALLLPWALGYWFYLHSLGESTFSLEMENSSLLLISTGIATAVPLLLFASAARRLSLTVLGFMMYINPTLQFLSALFILHEPFNVDQIIGFSFIWCALIVFTYGSIGSTKPAVYRSSDV